MGPSKSFFVVTCAVLAAVGIGVLIGFLSSDSQNSNTTDENPTYFMSGASKVDITGPIVEVNMMGYAHPEQIAGGLHTRLYSRSYVISDLKLRNKVAFVTFDGGMASQLLKLKVVEKLKETTDDFNEKNVMISGTHSHSGPAGFFQFLLFEVTSLGHVDDTTQAFVDGIAKSILQANSNMVKSKIKLGKQKLKEDANINRSPTSYLRNPEEERNKYEHNTDQEIDVISFEDELGTSKAMLSWYPSHPTSMNFTNNLISSDHKGRASALFENRMNKQNNEEFEYVGAFAQANVGDVSPRTNGPICIESENATSAGSPCSSEHSTCELLDGNNNNINRSQGCVAFGPGLDMFDSTDIIARRQYDAVVELFENNNMVELSGEVSFVHQFIDMGDTSHQLDDGRNVKSCLPGMGYSFAAGTTDGAGAFNFYQGMTEYIPFWETVVSILKPIVCTNPPTKEDLECHSPKPVLLPTGYMDKPRLWHPTIVEVQIFKIGSLVIAAVPGEFTTMSGRRLKDAIRMKMKEYGQNDVQVVIAGLSNVYTHYITTFEEYQAQRYEAASTIYGPHTLDIYLQKYKDLLNPLLNGGFYESGEPPFLEEPEQSGLSSVPGYDTAPTGKSFGDVLQDAEQYYFTGEKVVVKFQAANPRQNMKLGKTYLEVLKLNDDGSTQTVYNDADWSTKFAWARTDQPKVSGTDDVNIFSALSDVIAESTGVRFDINKAQKLNQEGRFECSEKMERNKLVECFKKSGVLKDESKTSQRKQSNGSSEVTITWEIPKKQTSGNYQIVYYGDSKNRKGEITSFEGRSTQFKVYY